MKLYVPFNATELGFMCVTFITGLAIAFLVPVLSIFLTDELHVRPLLVGLFFTVNAVTGIVVGQVIAHYSDRMATRKPVIIMCGMTGIIGCFLYAFVRNYEVLVSLGVFLMSVCGSITPQLYALAREYTDSENKAAVTFGTVMRAQFSLAWVVGPPIAFFIIAHFSFEKLFIGVAFLYLVCSGIIYSKLPNLPKLNQRAEIKKIAFWKNKPLYLIFLGSFLMWTCNSMYLITMPIYISKLLHWPQSEVGWLMGLAAGLEIPVMLLAGKYSQKVGNGVLLLISAMSAIFFYVILITCENGVLLFAAQGLNAIYIGIIAGIGMTVFQDLMPGFAGQASTLFSNSIRCGGIIAGTLAGVITEYFGYHGVFVCALMLAVMSFITILLFKKATQLNDSVNAF